MIPEEMQNHLNWILWHREFRANTDGKQEQTKVPYQGKDPQLHAASTVPTTWCDYKTVSMVTNIHKTGIGYVFDGTGIYGIDLDGAINPDGTVYPPFLPIITEIQSYQEKSPSLTGLHIIFRCDEDPYPSGKTKQWFTDAEGNPVDKSPEAIKREVGLFGRGKYFTVTNNPYNTIETIEKIPVEKVRELLDPFLGDKKPVTTQVVKSTSLTDDEIISLCHSAKNGNKFYDLFDKGYTTGYQSASEADLALAGIIRFYTQDVDQIKRIMERGALNREKYHREDYLDRTADKAVLLSGETYTAPTHRNTPAPIETITEDELEKIKANYSQTLPPEFPKLPDGFFKDYMTYATRLSYAVPAFHFGSILAVTSMIPGRTVVMHSTAQRLYCNCYVCIVGQTTTSGKSTSCNESVNNFFPVIAQDGIVEMLPRTNSPQSVVQRLSDVNHRLWFYDDCGEFYENVRSKWGAALVSELCQIYDGSRTSYGLAEGKGKKNLWTADKPYLSCLWNLTTSDMEHYAAWSLFSSGLLPRFMWFWNYSINEPKENRDIDEEDIRLRIGLEMEIQRLRKIIGKIPGENMIRFSTSKLIEGWKLKHDKEHLGDEDEVYRIATGRLFSHAYKIAMMFTMFDKEFQALIENTLLFPVTISIPDQHASAAITIIDRYLRPRVIEVSKICETNRTKSGQDDILKVLKRKKGVATKSEILKGTRIRSKIMTELLDTMVESGLICRKEITKLGGTLTVFHLK